MRTTDILKHALAWHEREGDEAVMLTLDELRMLLDKATPESVISVDTTTHCERCAHFNSFHKYRMYDVCRLLPKSKECDSKFKSKVTA